MSKIIGRALTYDDVQIVPNYSEVQTRKSLSLSTFLTKDFKRNIPLISASMDSITESEMMLEMNRMGGIGFLHRFLPYEERLKILKDVQSQMLKEHEILNHLFFSPLLGFTIGVKDEDLDFVLEVFNHCYSVDHIVLIDIAHGHHILMKKILKELSKLKKRFSFNIIAGNVATAQATKDLISWGADAVKVGIGGGSLCTTRQNTGVGVPMISSIIECSKAANGNIPIIADGGIKRPGDVAKAIAAGASSCMLGGILSGTKETPGEISKEGIWPNEILYKKYRGSASIESKVKRGEETKNVEGVSTLVEYCLIITR